MRSQAPAWLRRVLFRSVQAGMCPLIPLPFVDSWALAWVRRRMVRESYARRAIAIDDATLSAILADDEEPGLLQRGAKAVVLYPVKRIFRKVFYVLSVREAVNVAAATFQEGYLIARSLDSTRAPMTAERAKGVRRAVREACQELDPGPVRMLLERAFRMSRAALIKAASLLAQAWRGRQRRAGSAPPEPDAGVDLDDEKAIASVLDQLVEAVSYEQTYLDALEARFSEKMGRPTSPTTGGGPT